MKKYNYIMLLTLLLYLLLAAIAGWRIRGLKSEQEGAYKVEINRLQTRLILENELQKYTAGDAKQLARAVRALDISSCTYVREITCLTAEEAAQENGRSAEENGFWQPKNGMQYQIEPVYVNGALSCYIRYDYVLSTSYQGIFRMTEVFLLLMEIVVLVILFYLRQSVLLPFQRFAGLPEAMANGHLRNRVEENKSRYFGKFIWGIGLLQDRLDAERRRELKLEKEKKMLLLSLSHDIKKPLNTIKLYVKALEEGIYDTPEKQQKAVHQIGDKAAQIEHFMKEIVDTTREEAFDIEVKMGEFYLDEMVEQLKKTYQKRCELAHVAFTVGAFDNRLLKGDVHRAIEVLENIMENALKYGDGRAIAVTFYEEDYRQLIRIHNTGEPLLEQEMNHLFDSFFRGSNTEGKDGSGLGLYICRQIMLKMQGDIFAVRAADGMDIVLVFA